jgi:hypothetical protein
MEWILTATIVLAAGIASGAGIKTLLDARREKRHIRSALSDAAGALRSTCGDIAALLDRMDEPGTAQQTIQSEEESGRSAGAPGDSSGLLDSRLQSALSQIDSLQQKFREFDLPQETLESLRVKIGGYADTLETLRESESAADTDTRNEPLARQLNTFASGKSFV